MDDDPYRVGIYLDFDQDTVRVLAIVERRGAVLETLFNAPPGIRCQQGASYFVQVGEELLFGEELPTDAATPMTMELLSDERAKDDEAYKPNHLYFGARISTRGRRRPERVHDVYSSIRRAYPPGRPAEQQCTLNSFTNCSRQVDARKIIPLFLARVVYGACRFVTVNACRERKRRQAELNAAGEHDSTSSVAKGYRGYGRRGGEGGYGGYGVYGGRGNAYPGVPGIPAGSKSSNNAIRISACLFISWPDDSKPVKKFWTDCSRLAALALRGEKFIGCAPPGGKLRFKIEVDLGRADIWLHDPIFPSRALSGFRLYQRLWLLEERCGISPGAGAKSPWELYDSRVSSHGSRRSGLSGSLDAGKSHAHVLIDVGETCAQISFFLPEVPAVSPEVPACSSTLSIGSGESGAGVSGIGMQSWRGWYTVTLEVGMNDDSLDACAAKRFVQILRGGHVKKSDADVLAAMPACRASREKLNFREALDRAAKRSLSQFDEDDREHNLGLAYDAFMGSADLPLAECDLWWALGEFRAALGAEPLEALMQQVGPIAIKVEDLFPDADLPERVECLAKDLAEKCRNKGGGGGEGGDRKARNRGEYRRRSGASAAPFVARADGSHALSAMAYYLLLLEPFFRNLVKGLKYLRPLSRPSTHRGGRRSHGSVFDGLGAHESQSDRVSLGVGAILRRMERVNIYWAGPLAEFFPARYYLSEAILQALTSQALGESRESLGPHAPSDAPEVISHSFVGCAAARLWEMAYSPVQSSELGEADSELR